MKGKISEMANNRFLENGKQFLRTARELGRVGSLAGASVLMPVLGSAILLGVIYQISPWLDANKNAALPFFVAGVVFFAGFALLPTNVLGILSGWTFDFSIGFVAMLVGICGAATVSYFISRLISGERLQQIIERKPKTRALQRALMNEKFSRTLLFVTLLRLAPAMPFAVTNMLMATAGVPLKPFLIGTLLGMLPRSAAVVFVGSGLSELDFTNPQDGWLVILGVAATVITIIIIGIISKRALMRLALEENGLQAKNA